FTLHGQPACAILRDRLQTSSAPSCSRRAVSTDPVPPAAADPLRQPVHCLPGVTPARLEQLRRLGLATVGDVLFHFPRAYEDLTDLRAIAALTAGQTVTVQGEVVELDGRRLIDGRTVVSVVLCDDGKSCLEGVWFNQAHAAARFRYGQRLAFSGRVSWYRDHWQMTQPRVQILDGADASAELLVVPVYPLT